MHFIVPSRKAWLVEIDTLKNLKSKYVNILSLIGDDNIMSLSIYAVVEFVEEQLVALAAESWLVDNETSVMWPPYKSQTRVDKAVQKREPPMDGYQKFPCRVLYKTSKFKAHMQFIMLHMFKHQHENVCTPLSQNTSAIIV